MRQKFGLVFLLLAALGFVVWLIVRPDPYGNSLRVRQIATRGLADYLAQKGPGRRALIVSNPFTQIKKMDPEIRKTEEVGIRGLRDGFGQQIAVAAVAFPELREEARTNPRALLAESDTSTPLSYLVAPDAFDKLVQQQSDAKLLVSLIGLPVELEKCQAWTNAESPRFALLWPDLRMIGNADAVKKAVKSGKLEAVVLRKPGAPADAVPLAGNWKTEFDQRFLLVTGENVDEILQQYPALF